MSVAMPRVLLVGGGLTSALTSWLAPPGLELVVWDKARGAGGRATTSRSQGNRLCSVDMGAQYVTLKPHQEGDYHNFVSELEGAGVLAEFKGYIEGAREDEAGTRHYVAPEGMSSVVKHFFNKSGASVHFNRRVASLRRVEGGWVAETECGLQDTFHQVLLTMPVPQVLQLGGDIPSILETRSDIKERLESVKYSTRFVLAMFFDKQVDLGVPWAAKYINNNDIVRFVSVDNMKRGVPERPSSVLVHGNVRHGSLHSSATPSSMSATLESSVASLFPSWPAPDSVKPLKWLYSQVTHHYPGEPGEVALSQGLHLGGDAFATQSNFYGCLQSAKALASTISTINNLNSVK